MSESTIANPKSKLRPLPDKVWKPAPLRTHVEGCLGAGRIPVGDCACGGRDVVPVKRETGL